MMRPNSGIKYRIAVLRSSHKVDRGVTRNFVSATSIKRNLNLYPQPETLSAHSIEVWQAHQIIISNRSFEDPRGRDL